MTLIAGSKPARIVRDVANTGTAVPKDQANGNSASAPDVLFGTLAVSSVGAPAKFIVLTRRFGFVLGRKRTPELRGQRQARPSVTAFPPTPDCAAAFRSSHWAS